MSIRIIRFSLWIQSILVGGCLCLLILAIHLHLGLPDRKMTIKDHKSDLPNFYHSLKIDGRPTPSLKYLIEESAKFLPSLPIAAWEKTKYIYPGMYYKNSSCARYPILYNLHFDNTYWQTVESSNGTFHLYGAYYDVRSLLKDPVIRILSMINRIDPTVETYCQIWMDFQNEPLIVKSEKYRYIWYPAWGNYIQDIYQPYLISCTMPVGYQGNAPISVSLVENVCDNATNNLRVIFDKPVEKKRFAVCVKGLDFLYTDLSVKLVEWLELLQLLGVDKVFFYKLQVHVNTSKVLDYYEKLGKVDVTQLTLPGTQPNAPGFQHIYLTHKMTTKRQNELIPYNDCFYKNMYNYDYIALLDIDEVIVPINENTWGELMDRIEPLSLKDRSSPAASFNVRNAYFYDDLQRVCDRNNDIPPYMHMLQHTYRANDFSEAGKAVKCFHSTQSVLVLHNHYPLGCLTSDCFTYSVDTKDAILHHYREDCIPNAHQTCEQIKNESVFDDSIWRYKEPLIKNVVGALNDMGFFKKNV